MQEAVDILPPSPFSYIRAISYADSLGNGQIYERFDLVHIAPVDASKEPEEVHSVLKPRTVISGMRPMNFPILPGRR